MTTSRMVRFQQSNDRLSFLMPGLCCFLLSISLPAIANTGGGRS